jgi:glycerophosphoryl diester phosphodiesterase
MERPLAIAHRAGNSLAGLRAANELGVDVIECDVHDYRGRLEVRHLKTAGPLPFLWDRWELAPASVPRLGLDELLAAHRHGARFMLDIKGRTVTAARAVAQMLRAEDRQREVLVCSRHWPSVDAVAQLDHVQPVLSARNRVELERLVRRLRAAPGSAYGVSVHADLLQPSVAATLRSLVPMVMSWPINDPATLERLLAVGVNGVISDDAEILTTVLTSRSPAVD